MAGTSNDDLAELARLVGAHLDWQRELGVVGVALANPNLFVVDPTAKPRAARTAQPATATAAASTAVAAPAAEPVRPRLEIPSFLRKSMPAPKTEPSASPSRAPTPPTATESLPLEPAPAMPPVTAPSPRAPTAPTSREPSSEAADGDRVKQLSVINDEVVACQRCRLHEGRTQTVFSRGNPFAELAFVGEGPGRNEDLQGLPFVGEAGHLLDNIIAAMGMREQDVYICNVVKCRPPNNRVPAPDEMASCGPYLVRQLGCVKPRVIVALGKTAVSYLLESSDSMGKLRGTWREWQGIPLLATWHPAYLLRNPAAKKDTWDDMKLVLQRLGRTVPKR